MATEIHVKGALSSTTGYETMSSRGSVHSRVEGSKEEVALTHSFIAVDKPALGEV